MSFDDYIAREIKCSRRIQSHLSIILITSLKLKDNMSIIPQIEISNIEKIFSNVAQKSRNFLRTTDTVVMSKFYEIIIVLPFTDESGARKICEKIKGKIFKEVMEINADLHQYITPVFVTFPNEGENFHNLIENAFRKLTDKGTIKKISSIVPVNNQFQRWK